MENNPIKLSNVDVDATQLHAQVAGNNDDTEELLSDVNVSQETIEVGFEGIESVNESAEAIANENEILIDLASQSKGEPRSRSRASIVGTMLLAAGMGMGLAHSEDASAHDKGNILQVFGEQVSQGVNRQIYEAGRDSGGVMGGAARIIIDRTVNAATQRVLEGVGVPTARVPEEVVVVPRSVGYDNGGSLHGRHDRRGNSSQSAYDQRAYEEQLNYEQRARSAQRNYEEQANNQQRALGYGEVRYSGNVIVRGGLEGGYDRQMDNQMRDIEARYAMEKSRIMIEMNSNPEQLQAYKEQQELNLMRLNKSFKDRLDRAQPGDNLIVMKEWSAAKSQLLASQRTEGPQGRLAELEKRRAQDIAAVQIQSQRRAQGN